MKQTTEDPELADRFNRVLSDVVLAMEESGLKYAFIGGIASGGLGRPRSTHDIDIFVQPEDAELALRALSKRGFKTEKTDASWLYKGFKDNILVDVIFKSKGEIYLDSEMYERTRTARFHGQEIRLVAPEDLFIIKAAAHSELTPGHLHDAIGLLTHASIDWDYLIRRARRAPRRILSVLLYAQSNDVWVPNPVVQTLYTSIFGPPVSQHQEHGAGAHGAPPARASTPPPSAQQREERMNARPSQPSASPRPALASVPISAGSQTAPVRRAYAVAHLRERLAEDPRVGELDIQIEQSGDKLLLRGEVPSEGKRSATLEVARELFPDAQIECQIRIFSIEGPTEAEEVLGAGSPRSVTSITTSPRETGSEPSSRLSPSAPTCF